MRNNRGAIGAGLVIALAIIGVLIVGAVIIIGMFVSIMNKNAGLVNQFKAQQIVNTTVHDNMWKTLQQKAGISDQAADKFGEVYEKIMDARYQGKDDVLVNWVQEQNPNFDMSLYKDLSQAVEAYRNEFKNVQTKLIDIKRENDNLRTMFPSSVVLMIIGQKELEMKLVTSSRTEKAFDTGVDDDVQLFDNKSQPSEKVEIEKKKDKKHVAKDLSKIPVMLSPAAAPKK